MKKLLILLICLISFISYSQDNIELNYNTVKKIDTKTDINYIKILPTVITVTDYQLTILFNDTLLTYTIFISTYEYLTTDNGTPYITYEMINNSSGAISKCYHIKNDFILEEGYNIFTFYNN